MPPDRPRSRAHAPSGYGTTLDVNWLGGRRWRYRYHAEREGRLRVQYRLQQRDADPDQDQHRTHRDQGQRPHPGAIAITPDAAAPDLSRDSLVIMVGLYRVRAGP